MDKMIWDIKARNKDGLCARGRGIVRASNARVTTLSYINGIAIVIAAPFHMTKCSRDGLLLLDKYARPAAKEAFRDGTHSNCQVHMDVWPEGPKERGRYMNDIEQYARRDWPASLADGSKPRPAFELVDSNAIGRELAMRVLVDPSEIKCLAPEEVLLGRVRSMQRGDFDMLPSVLYTDKSKIYLKATTPGVVTKVTAESITVRSGSKRYRTFQIPEGLRANKRLRPGRRIRRGQGLFHLPAGLDISELSIAQILVDAMRSRIFKEDRGRELVRLGYATAVAHHCARCQTLNGVFPITRFLCPSCGKRVDSPRERGGQHLKSGAIKPDTCLECVQCGHTAVSEKFRKHRVCHSCGAAAIPALKKAYLSCNSRHYAVSPLSTGTYIPNPVDISFVKGFFRRLKKEGKTPQDLVQEAKCRTDEPIVTYVA